MFKVYFIYFLVVLFSLSFSSEQFIVPWGDTIGVYCGVVAYSNGRTGYVGPHGVYGYKYQCVEYVNRFYVEAFGHRNMVRTGNAKDYFRTASRRGLIAYANGGSVCPQVGDIICSNGGTSGHIAIVRQISWGTVHVIQQNWYNDNRDNDIVLHLNRTRGHYTITDGFGAGYPIQGWLRKPGISDTSWNFYNGRDGWVVDDSSSIIGVFYPSDAPDGAIKINPGIHDPRMWSPSGLYLNPTIDSGYTHVIIRMASNCLDLHAQLFYITTNDSIWDETKSRRFNLLSRGGWHIYDIDMSTDINWTHGGRITQLRLDPANNGDYGSTDIIGIDYIKLSKEGIGISEDVENTNDTLFYIFPNPFNSFFNIQAPIGTRIVIHSLSGHVILSTYLNDVEKGKYLNFNKNIDSGVYLAEAILPNGKVIVKKLIYIK